MTKGEELYDRLVHRKPRSYREWLELEKEIQDFFLSDAPEEEKIELQGYTEMLCMLCRGIEESELTAN